MTQKAQTGMVPVEMPPDEPDAEPDEPVFDDPDDEFPEDDDEQEDHP
jgi:hypothetical protein